MRLVQALVALGGLGSALAQSSTAPPSTTSSPTDSSSAALSTTLTGAVVSGTTTPSSTSASVPRPSANVTTGADQSLQLWAPVGGLVMCERVTFAFTGPSVPKTCGVYVTNTSTYIQQIPLGGTYTSLMAGTFSWLVDMPAGLSVNVQFWVTLNGAVQQFTLPSIIIQSSSDNSCLGTGQGQNTQSIISYASALNGSYVWTAPTASATSKGSSTNVGAIVGGIVGGLAALCALLLGVYLLYRRRKRSAAPPPPDGEKPYDPSVGGPTYAQLVAMKYAGHGGPPGAQGVTPYQSAPPSGFAAEPMPATPPASSAPLSPGGTSEFGAPTPSVGTGTLGLDDPASFLGRGSASERGRAV